MRFQLSGEVGKDACPNFHQPLLESFDRSGCNYGSRELIPIFHNPHRKCRPSPLGVARTLEHIKEVPSKFAESGREKKLVRVKIQETREYLECGNQVDLYPSPLQGMK